MAVFYVPITEAFQDGIRDARNQVEDDFHCLAWALAQNAWLLFLAGCGTFFLAVGLVTTACLGVISAVLVATVPYIYVSYLTLKMLQRYRLRYDDDDDDDDYKEQLLSMLDIVMIMAHHPREKFVPNNELDQSSDKQLHRMLMIRRPMIENNKDWAAIMGKDRSSLVDAVEKCRKYNETCSICFENYQTGDYLRVLSQCHHEFHEECIKKWAGTFATSSKGRRGAKPTCPLCNESLCHPCNLRVD
jgi:Ring finger domain